MLRTTFAEAAAAAEELKSIVEPGCAATAAELWRGVVSQHGVAMLVHGCDVSGVCITRRRGCTKCKTFCSSNTLLCLHSDTNCYHFTRY